MHGREAAAETRAERIEAVLLVEADPAERERIGSILERWGYQVSVCPGPTGPDYTCVGSREGGCALTSEGAVIVLDMSLDSEAVVSGTAAEELLALYLFGGHRIVVLGSYPGADVPGQMIRLPRHPEPSVLTAAVRSLERHVTDVGL
jgi:CheY-like chemotaxis protein